MENVSNHPGIQGPGVGDCRRHTLIPKYHPEVTRVDLLSGQGTRGLGVRYQCTVSKGRKGSCVEQVVNHIPGERTATAFPEDTWGLSEMFSDFVVETVLVPHGDGDTALVLEAYYEPIGWKTRLLNVLLLRRLMARRARRTIEVSSAWRRRRKDLRYKQWAAPNNSYVGQTAYRRLWHESISLYRDQRGRLYRATQR